MTTQFKVEKMMCDGCSSNVKKALDGQTGVNSVEVNLDAKTVTVTGNVDSIEIAKIITAAGYPASAL